MKPKPLYSIVEYCHIARPLGGIQQVGRAVSHEMMEESQAIRFRLNESYSFAQVLIAISWEILGLGFCLGQNIGSIIDQVPCARKVFFEKVDNSGNVCHGVVSKESNCLETYNVVLLLLCSIRLLPKGRWIEGFYYGLSWTGEGSVGDGIVTPGSFLLPLGQFQLKRMPQCPLERALHGLNDIIVLATHSNSW